MQAYQNLVLIVNGGLDTPILFDNDDFETLSSVVDVIL